VVVSVFGGTALLAALMVLVDLVTKRRLVLNLFDSSFGYMVRPRYL
jgi:hypothetical protein